MMDRNCKLNDVHCQTVSLVYGYSLCTVMSAYFFGNLHK